MANTKQKVQTAEDLGRDMFRAFLQQIKATGTPTKTEDRLDYYFTLSNGKKGVAEIKVRYKYYRDYLIEESKYQELKDRKEKQNLDMAWYVCFFNNQMYIFTPKVIRNYPTVWKWCKKTTVKEDTEYVWKLVRLPETDKATKLIYKNNKWQKA